MILENKLGITDSVELASVEEKKSKRKALEIHKYLFDEIIEKYVEMNIAHPFRDGVERVENCRLPY